MTTDKILVQKIDGEFNYLPPKQWFTLKEACFYKNLNYKTACNRPYLKPNKGKPDATIGGKNVFSRSTLLAWLLCTDDQLKNEMN